MVFNRITKLFKTETEEDINYIGEEEPQQEYVEIKPLTEDYANNKLSIKYFVLTEFEDVKPVLESIRDGYTIAFIKIKPLKDKNINELRRTIDKIKKTCFAIDGEVVGLEEDWIVAVPPYVNVHRGGA